jgi:tetratricopeptide (TPR) repeat protein
MQNQSERLDDLDMLENARQALGMCQVDHPDRPKVLDDLAFACQTRLETVGDLESLAEVVVLRRQALDLRPPGHPDRFVSLNNLANALQAQFQQLGDSDVLAEALDLHRQALNLRPPGHPDRFASLNNLANALQARFQQLGDSDSLAEALDLHRQALNLRPPGHHDRFVSLNNLANALPARFQQLGDTDSLAEALDLHRQALDLRPAGHRDRSASLNNLANALHTQFERLGDSDSLDEALDLHRQALELRPYPHPDRPSSLTNLGIALEARFAKQSLAPDLDEALEIAREGLRSCAPGHPMRVRFLFMIAKCLLQPGSRVFDFENGIHHISEGLRNRSSPASQTLRHTIHILPTVEAAMQFSAESASGVNMSQLDRHDVVLQVYVLVLELLPRAASFGLDHIGRLNALSGAETISRDAAALAVLAGRTTEAVELLEEGRGVFWLQAFRLRSADLDLVPDQDAQELRRLSKALEAGGTHDCSMSAAQRERHVEERRRLSAAAESLLEDIRTRPAMSRFLLPPAFDLLVQSLPETGFVVMLVASALGHYALVLNRAAAEVKHVTLATPPGGGFSRTFRAALPRDGGQEPASPEDIDIAHSMSRDLCEEMLAQLWTLVVKPVVGLLKLKVCLNVVRCQVATC